MGGGAIFSTVDAGSNTAPTTPLNFRPAPDRALEMAIKAKEKAEDAEEIALGIEQKAIEALNLASNVFTIASDAFDKAEGTIRALTFKDSCIYDLDQPCDEDMLKYRTSFSIASDQTTWTVPDGITSFYVAIKGGNSYNKCFGDCEEQIASSWEVCIKGGSVMFDSLTASGGSNCSYPKNGAFINKIFNGVKGGDVFNVQIAHTYTNTGHIFIPKVKGNIGKITIKHNKVDNH